MKSKAGTGSLKNTKPQWGITQGADGDGRRVDPDASPRIFSYIRCLPGLEISDSRLVDDETLLNFRNYRE
jgi:hypothetical protein